MKSFDMKLEDIKVYYMDVDKMEEENYFHFPENFRDIPKYLFATK